MSYAISQVSCLYTLIYTSCVLLVTWPLYLFFLIQWRSHRHHFVIRNRWPIISLTIVGGSVIVQILTIFQSALCIPSPVHFSMAVSIGISGLFYYRSHLLYAETMKTRQYLAAEKHMILRKEHIDCYQNWSRLLLFIVLTTPIAVVVSRLCNIGYILWISFSIHTLVGMICMVNILREKISDSIGITKECLFCVISNFSYGIFAGATRSLFPPDFDVNVYVGLLLTTLYGLTTLFTAYNVIRKGNKTIDTNSTMSSQSSVDYMHRSAGLNITELDNNAQSDSDINTHTLSQWAQKPLSIFLYNNLENLSAFAAYLSECFALENILFLERAIILHHLIKKYAKDDHIAEDLGKYSCYDLQFTFMTQIYENIEAMIENDEKHVQNDDIMYKRGILNVMKCIYDQFCANDSDTEINIGYEIRNDLYEIFEKKTDDERLKMFTNYKDLLMVFHPAIVECWIMCKCVYCFRFKSYLRNKAKLEEENKVISESSLVNNDSMNTNDPKANIATECVN